MITFDDHGVKWRRLAQREWADVGERVLFVTAPYEGGGYVWGVIDRETKEPIRSGRAATRSEARRLAVFALAEGEGLATPDTPPTANEVLAMHEPGPMSPAMRLAASVLLAFVLAVCIVTIARGCT